MIPTFNGTATLRRTIESVLASRGRHEMQIEVVDDCSFRDSPEQIVELYRGYGVELFRQQRNVGASANFNTCIARAKGEWVHILHCDDYVGSDFYSALEKGLLANQDAQIAFTSFLAVDENGRPAWQPRNLPNGRGVVDRKWRDHIAVQNVIMAPAVVVRKSAYEAVGGFSETLTHCADWDMWKRLIWRYDAWFEPEILAFYLVHPQSATFRLMQSGENIKDSLRAIAVGERYLPVERREELSRLARKYHARLGLSAAHRFLAKRSYRAAWAQLQATSALSPGSVALDVPDLLWSLMKGCFGDDDLPRNKTRL